MNNNKVCGSPQQISPLHTPKRLHLVWTSLNRSAMIEQEGGCYFNKVKFFSILKMCVSQLLAEIINHDQ